MKTEYKNIEIQYYENSNIWGCNCDYGECKKDSLRAVKNWIDKKEKNEFKRYEVIVETYYNIDIAIVTSETENEAWVKYNCGTREKVLKSKIIKKTNDNMELYNQIKEVEKECKIFVQNNKAEINELMKMLFKRE